MSRPAENDETRLERELDALLLSLGVRREESPASLQPQSDLHITCFYSERDAALWQGLELHLRCLKPRTPPSLVWHMHSVSNKSWMRDTRTMRQIKGDVLASGIVLIGLSVHLVVSLCEHADYIYHVLAQRMCMQEELKIISIRLREVSWEDDILTNEVVPTGNAIASRRERDKAYTQVSQTIARAIALYK